MINASKLVKFDRFLGECRHVFRHSLAIAVLAGFAPMSLSAATLTYKDLVKRLTDMEQIAVLPVNGEKSALASSYDRKSVYDASADKYIDWNVNADGTGVVRKEGDNDVLADIQGPGCIWRTWSATIAAGHVKIYLDGAETPAVDLPFKGYFSGTNEPFTRKNLVYKTTANGFNNFTPIPFQKSCKIVADKDWGRYYHFNYTTFPAGTVVPTFKLPLSSEDTAALDEANRIMGQCGQAPTGNRPGQETETMNVTVPAGGKSTVANLTGPQAITGLKVQMELPKDVEQQRTLLAQLTVSVTWDNETAPAVWSPLGDFFGSAAGAVPFQTLTVGLLLDGNFYCYWYMPFSSKAHIEVGNDSAQPVSMKWEVVHAPLDQPINQLGRFHAKWHRDALLPDRADRQIDWTLLKTQGKGRYVGTQLHVWNPRGGWWGEGDEKFFVDGEPFPSTFGTGTEDYFGYAWSSGTTFIQALHSQPVNENNQGHVSVNRWHIADNIPFQTSFEGDIEKYFFNQRGTLFSAVVFWYLNAGGHDPYASVPVSERIGWWVRPVVYEAKGVIEGESLRVIGRPIHAAGSQEMWVFGDNIWSGNKQFHWNSAEIGETVGLELPVQAAGKYRLLARFTKTPVSGTIQMSVNAQKVGSPVDLYAEKCLPGDPVDLGTVDLPEGKQTLTLDVVGKNEASRGFVCGIDYIKLVPVK